MFVAVRNRLKPTVISMCFILPRFQTRRRWSIVLKFFVIGILMVNLAQTGVSLSASHYNYPGANALLKLQSYKKSNSIETLAQKPTKKTIFVLFRPTDSERSYRCLFGGEWRLTLSRAQQLDVGASIDDVHRTRRLLSV